MLPMNSLFVLISLGDSVEENMARNEIEMRRRTRLFRDRNKIYG